MSECFVKIVQSGVDARVMYAADNQIKSLLEPLKDNPRAQEAASILLDFQKMVFNGKGGSALTVLRSVGEVPDTMDDFVSLYSGGIYKKTEALVKDAATNEQAMGLLRTVGQKAVDTLQKFATYREDFGATVTDKEHSDFFRLLSNFVLTHKGTNMGTLALGNKYLRAKGYSLAYKSPLINNDPELAQISKEFIGINNSLKTYNNELDGLLSNLYKSHNREGLVGSALINKFMSQTSGIDYTESKTKAEALAAEVYESNGFANPNKLDKEVLQQEVVSTLMSFKKRFDYLNYGYDIEKLEADTKAMSSEDKNKARIATLTDLNNLNMLTNAEGEAIPPLYWMTHTINSRLAALAKQKQAKGLDLESIEQQLIDKFDPTNPQFSPRTYYVPSEMEDLLGVGSMTGRSQSLCTLPSHLRSKVGKGDTDDIDVAMLLKDNMKSMQSMVERVSTYTTATLQNKIIEDRFDQDLVPKELATGFEVILSDNRAILQRLEPGSLAKQQTKGMQIAKQISSAYISLTAGALLTASAVNNYLGGVMGIGAALGIKDSVRIIGQYRKALGSADPVQTELRKMIDDRFRFVNPISTKSEMIMSAREDQALIEGGISRITDMANKAGDWLLAKGLVGWIPILKDLAFNESENNLSKIQNAILYDRVHEYVGSAVRENNIPMYEGTVNGKPMYSKQFQNVFNEAMDLFENDARKKGYEAIGQFDSTAKSQFFTKGFKTAEDWQGVFMGTFMLTFSMFKTVGNVNLGILNRVGASMLNPANFKSMSAIKQNMSSYNNMGSVTGAIAMGLVSFYEWLAEEYGYVPQTYGVYNANPAKLPVNVVTAATGLYYSLSGEAMNSAQQAAVLDLARSAGGVSIGGTIQGYIMDQWLDQHPLTPYIKRYQRQLDLERNWYTMLAESVVPVKNPRELWQYQTKLNLARTEPLPGDGDGFSLYNAPGFGTLPIIGSNNKVSKVINDAALILSSMEASISFSGKDRDRAMSKLGSDFVQLAKDISGVSVSVPYETIDRQKYYDYSRDYRLDRLGWERKFHGNDGAADFIRSASKNHGRIIRIQSKNDRYLSNPQYSLDRIPPKTYPLKPYKKENR